jgi:fibronectin-binding autotransporter adhesin
MISLFSKIFSSRKSKSKRQPANAFSFPNQLSLQKLEDRITPAIGSLVGTTLTIDYTATGTTAETVSATNDGTNITLTGDITGTTSFTTSNITKISITNSGTSTNQTFNLDGSAGYNLQNGLNSAGVDVVNINKSVDSSTGVNANITISDAIKITVIDDISSGSGNITLDADNGTSQPGSFNGVFIDGPGVDITTTTGNIQIDGRGSTGTAGSFSGILLNQFNSIKSTSSGNISLTGFGGATTNSGSFGPNIGLDIRGLVQGNGGTITLNGTGGTGVVDSYYGVAVFTGSQILNSGSGTISLTGTGGNNTTNFNYGVVLFDNSTIQGESGGISITGTGGGTGVSDQNHGVNIKLSGSAGSIAPLVKTTAGGAISLTGTKGLGSSSLGINLQDGSVTTVHSSAAPGAITLETDVISITNATVTTTSTVTLRNKTANVAIDVGTASTSSFGLSDTQLDKISAGTLVVGRNDSAASGAITVSSALTLVPNLDLVGPSGINLNANLTTTGSQTYSGAVTLGNSVTVATTNTNILFSSTVNGGSKNLSIGASTAGGTTTFTNTVTALGSGTGAALNVASGVTGLVRFQNTLAGNSGITALGTTSNLRFDGNVTLGNGDTGTTLAGTTILDGLTFTGNDGITMNVVNLSTAAVDINTQTGDVNLNGSINGAVGFKVRSDSAIALAGNIGNSNAPTSVDMVATTTFTGAGTIKTTGTANLGGSSVGNSTTPITLDSTSGLTATSTGNGNLFLGALSNSIPITLFTAGTGTISIKSGTYALSGSNKISDDSKVNLDGGVLNMAGFTETIGALLGSTNLSTSTGARLTLGGNTTDTYSGIMSGPAELIRTGNGTTTLSGQNTYTGNTTLYSGKLIVLADQASNYTVSGGTLGGTGKVGTLTSTIGNIAPGTSPGKLTSGNFSLTGPAAFLIDIQGTVPGTSYDQMVVNGTVNLGNSTLTVTTTSFTPVGGDEFVLISNDGTDAVKGTFKDYANNSIVTVNGINFQITYFGGDGNDVVLRTPLQQPVISSAAPSSNGGTIHITFAGSSTPTVLTPFTGFFGEIRVSSDGDFNSDGIGDVVAVPGPTGGPRVTIMNGSNGAVIANFFAYDPSFVGGLYVAAADVTGDHVVDLITGAGIGGGPHVKVWDGTTLSNSNPTVVTQFFAYATTFTGGVTVAAGDLSGDNIAEIVTGAGAGGGPQVNIYQGGTFQLQSSFFAYGSSFTGGVYVAVGDVTGDGQGDIVTGAGAGGGPQVSVFNGQSLQLQSSFFAYSVFFGGGVRVGTIDFTGNGIQDIVTGAGPGAGPHVIVQDFDNNILDQYFSGPETFQGGVFVS